MVSDDLPSSSALLQLLTIVEGMPQLGTACMGSQLHIIHPLCGRFLYIVTSRTSISIFDNFPPFPNFSTWRLPEQPLPLSLPLPRRHRLLFNHKVHRNLRARNSPTTYFQILRLSLRYSASKSQNSSLVLSMGWTDNILLGVGPLGIVTTLVSAIRVGGASKLKALIGR